MPKNILDVIMNTINDVQQRNRQNPRERTADSSVFDLLRDKVSQLDQKSKQKRIEKGKSPVSILDLIKNQIEGARKENEQDPNVETAPTSIFDKLIKKIDQNPKRQATTGLNRIAQIYNLDLSRLPRAAVQQIHERYVSDHKKLDQQYANFIHDLIQKH